MPHPLEVCHRTGQLALNVKLFTELHVHLLQKQLCNDKKRFSLGKLLTRPTARFFGTP